MNVFQEEPHSVTNVLNPKLTVENDHAKYAVDVVEVELEVTFLGVLEEPVRDRMRHCRLQGLEDSRCDRLLGFTLPGVERNGLGSIRNFGPFQRWLGGRDQTGDAINEQLRKDQQSCVNVKLPDEWGQLDAHQLADVLRGRRTE